MKVKQYKIVYCTPALYSAGGTERAVIVKANYFADVLRYDVTIIVTEGNSGNAFFNLSNRVKVINLGIHFEELWNQSFFRKTILYLEKQKHYRKRLKEELLRIKPDITISTLRREINFLCSIHDGSFKIGELHHCRDNYRGFCSDNNIAIQLFYSWWKRDVVNCLRKLNCLVVLTEDAMNEWPELNNKRMIPDPLSIGVSGCSNLDAKRVITVGRYSYEKGYDLLIKAWAIIERSCPDWELDIYAMGDPTPYVKQIDQLSIDHRRCHLNSSLVNVKTEYLKSSILAQPSRTEGFGLVIIEAMACGLPVVAFDCENGPRSIITDEVDGFLVPPFDINQFAEQLIRLMKNHELRKSIGYKGRIRSQHFHIENIASQWTQLFDELMNAE